MSRTIEKSEVEKFTSIAHKWWDEEGEFKPLHKFNPVRIAYLRDKICEHFNRDVMAHLPLEGLEILDIGCGGGLLSVPLARLGAKMTSIDAGKQNIDVAKTHAKGQNLDINYIHITAEELVTEGKKFDIVLNMEVIEHVADVDLFMESSANLLKDGGVIFVATLNRTLKSYAFAIIGAEYVMKWLPRGTHDWKKFLKPHQIVNHLEHAGLKLQEIKGISYKPLQDKFYLSDDISVNYMLMATK